MSSFRVGLTRDFLNSQGRIGFGDISLDLLDEAPGVERQFLPEHSPALTAEQVDAFDALLVLAPRVTRATLEGAERLKLVARFGVGYDNVDVDACTDLGVLLTITPDGVRRPVAVSAITLMLAISHKLLIKDRLTRSGRWSDKLQHMGCGVTGRTLGLIGLGNIGREIVRLVSPLQMNCLAFDPHVPPEGLDDLNVALVDLETLLRQADYLAVCCALVPETRHLINASRLAMLKPSAYLINVARGPIVDQPALTEALASGRLAGAALDVFEEEPVNPADPLLQLDNVIVTPHAICWTDELARGNGRAACQSILDVAAGRVPRHVVNRGVLEQPQLRTSLTDR